MCIQDKILLDYLEDNYNVTKKEINEEFIKNIEIINLDKIINYNELLLFKNLKELILNNIIVDNNLYKVLSKLNIKKITFIDCRLESFEYFNNNLEYLAFNNCEIENIYEIGKFKNLNSLYLDEVNEINLEYFPNIKFIENISFLNTKVINEDKLIILDKIKNLCLTGTNIKNIDTLAYNETLKKLVIDKEIYDNNKKVIEQLIKNGVEVVDYMNQEVESIYGI